MSTNNVIEVKDEEVSEFKEKIEKFVFSCELFNHDLLELILLKINVSKIKFKELNCSNFNEINDTEESIYLSTNPLTNQISSKDLIILNQYNDNFTTIQKYIKQLSLELTEKERIMNETNDKISNYESKDRNICENPIVITNWVVEKTFGGLPLVKEKIYNDFNAHSEDNHEYFDIFSNLKSELIMLRNSLNKFISNLKLIEKYVDSKIEMIKKIKNTNIYDHLTYLNDVYSKLGFSAKADIDKKILEFENNNPFKKEKLEFIESNLINIKFTSVFAQIYELRKKFIEKQKKINIKANSQIDLVKTRFINLLKSYESVFNKIGVEIDKETFKLFINN